MPDNSSISNFEDSRSPKAFLLSVCVLAALYAVELFVLPINFFTFRAWEALCVVPGGLFDGPFYPNQRLSMNEQGVFGRRHRFGVEKKVLWETDQYGYRKAAIHPKIEVVIVGDSFTAGSGLTQEDMLSEILERRLNVGVYPWAPGSVESLLRSRLFQEDKPRVVIVEAAEERMAGWRTIAGAQPQAQKGGRVWSAAVGYGRRHPETLVLIDRVRKAAMFNYLTTRLKESLKKAVTGDGAILVGGAPKGPWGAAPNMLFTDMSSQEAELLSSIDQIVANLKSYDASMKEKGIRFIFLPVPNKETVYPECYPGPCQKIAFRRLVKRAQEARIETVDTLDAFKRAKKRALLYQTDDTHWNAEGVRVTAGLVEQMLSSRKLVVERP